MIEIVGRLIETEIVINSQFLIGYFYKDINWNVTDMACFPITTFLYWEIQCTLEILYCFSRNKHIKSTKHIQYFLTLQWTENQVQVKIYIYLVKAH